MIDLNDLEEIKKLDPKSVFASTGMLANQCEQILKDAELITLPSFENIENVIIAGMGGSAYGAHVAISLLKHNLTKPLMLIDDYDLPAWVNKNTLVLLTSYSGSTEEPLAAAEHALQKGAMIAGLTSGGPLVEFLKKYAKVSLIFDPKHNLSGQPRLGTGYIVYGTIALLVQLGIARIERKDLKRAIDELKESEEEIKVQAQDVARKLLGRLPVVIAADFLKGNAHIIRNQFNETAKSFAAYSELPELNHHLMEGLQNPKDLPLSFVYLNSNLYPEIMKKRVSLTQEVVEKNNKQWIVFDAKGSSKTAQMLSALSFGGYLTVYLALLYGLDPSLIPWVDYFKEELSK